MDAITRDDLATFEWNGKPITVRVLRQKENDCFFFTMPRGEVEDVEIALFKQAIDEAGLTPALIWADISDLGAVSREELASLRDVLTEFLGDK